MKDAVAVLVHGLFSSTTTWDSLRDHLAADRDINRTFDLKPFGYYTPKAKIRPARRIPDFGTVAGSLATFLDVECADYRNVVLIAHSQGGLIVQRYLDQMLSDGRGRELARIRGIVLLACPNNGSEFLLVLRRAVGLIWPQPQERHLRPYADAVAETQRRVLSHVVFADAIASDRCPIPFVAYVGESDNIVTPASAKSVFPRWGTLPGDHNSILRVDSVQHRTYTTIKANLLQAVKDTAQTDLQASLGAPGASLSTEGYLEYRNPIMKVTSTTKHVDATQSHEIEIFDIKVADSWIRLNRPAPFAGEEEEE